MTMEHHVEHRTWNHQKVVLIFSHDVMISFWAEILEQSSHFNMDWDEWQASMLAARDRLGHIMYLGSRLQL